MSVYVASGIAGSDQTKTGIWAVRLGLIGFIIPFFFLNNPILLLGADKTATFAQSAWTFFTACVGTVSLVAGLEGWLLQKARLLERLVLILAAPFLLYPGMVTDGAGFVCLAAVLLLQFFRRSKLPAAPAK
jgi:TRAP-type uncharacterized transport system fused permease subunit